MSASALVAQLAAAGTPPELLAAVAEQLFKAEIELAALETIRKNEREKSARYRARGGEQISIELRQAVFERDGYQCQECHSESHLQCDHVVSLAAGGETSLDNLQVLCRPCNARKKDRVRKSEVRLLSKEVRGQSQTSEEVQDSPCPLTPPLKSAPNPTKITPPISPKPTTELRARRLPDDWKPLPLTGKAAAMVALWQPGEVERELAKFRNYWMGKAGKDACKTDWQRTWINWLISADERKPRNVGQHQLPGIGRTEAAAIAAFASISGQQR